MCKEDSKQYRNTKKILCGITFNQFQKIQITKGNSIPATGCGSS
jgi:hypothetical protein